ncbi:MAG: ATP-dependent DNA helicase UvrD2 [Actinomycetota bacterium]|nr:ATP-dependent DNA helicase UvrD2 [Actinomycetota bacterium]
MDAESLLDGLNERQYAAVTHTGGPLVVMAGAGSGKTRVLTRRIAHRVVIGDTDPRRVLALTFTRKAAAELRTRLRHLGLRDDVVAGTFHGVALTQLRQRWAERGITPPAILDRKYRFVSQLMGRRPGVEPLDVVSEIEWARARLVSPEQYPVAAELAGRTSPLPPAELAELIHRFAQEKRQRRVVDFDDLLALAARDLLVDPDYAAAVRWRHRHLYVDEFQDVNPLQHELLKAWRGQSSDLFVVGDPNQAIYGWNGADPNLLRTFTRREPDATVIDLTDNYRSTPQILGAAFAALGGRGGQMTANRSDGPLPTITAYASDHDEARGIAEAIRAAKTVDRPWADQAVLVRTNAQLVPIEQALVTAGVPTRVRGGSGPLATPEVKAELRVLGRSGGNLLDALRELDENLALAASKTDDLAAADIERNQNVDALSRLAHDYLTIDPSPTGPGLLAWVTTIAAGDVHLDHDAVELATFHGAKGLEWPIVYLAGLEQGFVPISHARTAEQIAEEQRLLYVGVTRAEHTLSLSWAAERTFGTRPAKRQPSPHLGALQAAIQRLDRGRWSVDWQTQVSRSRHALGTETAPTRPVTPFEPATTPEDQVLAALQAWRRNRARAADVPAFVIFTDQTLRALVQRMPANRAQLAATPGVGAVKLDRYGDELLDLLRQSTRSR